MKWHVGILIGCLIMIGIPSFGHSSIVKTLSGRVVKVDSANNFLYVHFEHPVTGREHELIFQMDHRTGFNGITEFTELQPSDPVTIDYEEADDGLLLAFRVAKVRLSGPPPGLEDFRGL